MRGGLDAFRASDGSPSPQESQIWVRTPARQTPSTAQVTVANDGYTFSAYPLVFIKGSGSFLKFIFDNSDPGCLDCLNSRVISLGLQNTTVGLNPSYITEKWAVDNATGPYIGGTDVRSHFSRQTAFRLTGLPLPRRASVCARRYVTGDVRRR